MYNIESLREDLHILGYIAAIAALEVEGGALGDSRQRPQAFRHAR